MKSKLLLIIAQVISTKANRKKGNKSFSRPANHNNNAFSILITANVTWKTIL